MMCGRKGGTSRQAPLALRSRVLTAQRDRAHCLGLSQRPRQKLPPHEAA